MFFPRLKSVSAVAVAFAVGVALGYAAAYCSFAL